MGFLEEPASSLRLTPLGIMATEINEGHPILMTQAYAQGLMKGLSGEMILSLLTVFMQEGGEPGEIPKELRDIIRNIECIAKENERLETKRAPRDSYWRLNTSWVEPMWLWLNGSTMEQICMDYGCYEGNFTRFLSKVVNLLEELRSLATLSKDTEMLEVLRGMEQLVMRDTAVCDSLYLRL